MSVIAKAPATREQCSEEWIAVRREIILRVGYAVRAGEGGVDLAGAPYTIEVKSLTTNEWWRLMLPNDGTEFAHAAERDAVLQLLLQAPA